MAANEAIYVRNGHPNRVAFVHAGTRIALDRRGSRTDTTALPKDALDNPTVSRFIKDGVLEKITRDQFMKLGARQIDIEPNQFLKRPVRTGKTTDLLMHPAEADTTKSPSSVREQDVRKSAVPRLEWAGELMSTAEELEEMDYSAPENNYPSHHRDDENSSNSRQRGY